MSNDKYEKIKYEIYPMKSLGSFLGIIASITGIGMAIYLLEGLWQVVTILSLIIAILLYFLIIISLRLRTTKNDYNKIVDEINHANDNRQTLANIIDQKNKELENLNIEFRTQGKITRFIVNLLYSEGRLPKRKLIEDVLEIEEKGAINHEEQ